MTYQVPLLVIKKEDDAYCTGPNEDLQQLESLKIFHSADNGSTNGEGPCTDLKDSFLSGVRPSVSHDKHQLMPYTTVVIWRTLPRAIWINNKAVTRYKAQAITEYLDQSTGEIIKTSDLKNDPRVPQYIYFGEIILLRQSLINSLRSEVREFALFVLRFRNNRRGITPEINTLVKWYARLFDKRPSNVKRYVAALEKSGFLIGSSLLSRLFQRTGSCMAAKDHLGEDVEARRTYFALRSRHKSVFKFSSINAATSTVYT